MAHAKEQHAALDSMILEQERVVSFRTLSSELKIPVKQAQNILSDYVSLRRDKVVASWAVTSEDDSIRKVALVYGERPTVKDNVLYVTVWGLAASKATLSLDDWMRCDRLREIRMVDTPSSAANELQDNRWNPIRSDSAGWSAGGSAAQMRDRMEALTMEKARALKLKQDTGTVAKVKAEASEKLKKFQGQKKSSFQFSRPSSSNGATQKSISSRSIGNTTNKKQQRPTPAPVTKKTRRVIEISDDEDDSDESGDDAEKLAMEAEADEADRAAHERNDNMCAGYDEVAEVEVEVEVDIPLNNSKPTKNQKKSRSNSANQMHDTADKEKNPIHVDEEERERGSKRDFQTTFGCKPENQTKYRMIEMEETVELADGYIGTRRVKKYVDKDGKEKPAEDVTVVEKGNLDKPTSSNGKTSPAPKILTRDDTPPARKKEEAIQNGKTKKGGSGKSTKRGNGSILSFFTKKS